MENIHESFSEVQRKERLQEVARPKYFGSYIPKEIRKKNKRKRKIAKYSRKRNRRR